MQVSIGADHGGFALKIVLLEHLKMLGHEVRDLGTYDSEPVDYPDYARAVANAIIDGRAERGILICGSGVGACVAANKFPEIRAAICHDTFSGARGVEDNDECLVSWCADCGAGTGKRHRHDVFEGDVLRRTTCRDELEKLRN